MRPADLLNAPGAGLLLDLDGTLVDSEAMHQGILTAYFASRGWEVPEQVVRSFSGRRGADVFASTAGPWSGEPVAEVMAGIVAMRSDRWPEPVPGAALMLRHWRGVGLPVAIVTSAGRGWAQHCLGLLGADDLGIEIIGAEDCPAGKPDPLPYVLGAQQLGVHVGACVAAEDTPAGLRSARAAGVGHLLGVTTTNSADVLRSAGADTTTADLTILLP